MTNSAKTATDRAAELFHAFSDETRLELIHLLRKGERCVCDLTSALDAAQSRLSFHLKVLKDAGIVHDSPRGRTRVYSIDAARLARYRGQLDQFWSEALGNLGATHDDQERGAG